MNKPMPRDLEALMELFEKSDWKELDLRMEGFELYLSKDPTRRRAQGHSTHAGVIAGPAAAPVAAPASPAAPTSAAPIPSHWIAVKAPNLGTFYRAPKPGAAPYVEIGQSVTPETEVCLIEVMKLFTSVRSGVTGTVRQIAVQDGQMVEHDQVLLYIEPA
ncbi:MAG: acetyl-CoA carboxylase biotin carboxyl carrier protein [Panacagrimonas sp.]